MTLSEVVRSKVYTKSKAGWIVAVMVGASVSIALLLSTNAHLQHEGKRLITVYDRGAKSAFLSNAKTLGVALEENGYTLDERDTVEPSREEELIAPNYHVNIYRARPVTVSDGAVRLKTVSPYQSPKRIAEDAGFILKPEDTVSMERSTDYVYDGAGLKLEIDRAYLVRLDLYGRVMDVYTQGDTIAQMLLEKKITLGVQDRVSLSKDTRITEGMAIRIWREGKQTVSIDEATDFGYEIVYDADRALGYRAVQTPGQNGVRTRTFEIEIKDGVEIARVEIANVVTRDAKKQVEVIGLKNDGRGLTKSKGAQHFTDSRGITHRETYYDLDMKVVMQACRQGGYYTVRPDGAKVDSQGYVIIAANYARYPRCSIVETSLGPGKVYDTGGFAKVHPDGFDLATDWTRYDGI